MQDYPAHRAVIEHLIKKYKGKPITLSIAYNDNKDVIVMAMAHTKVAYEEFNDSEINGIEIKVYYRHDKLAFKPAYKSSSQFLD